MPDEIALRDEHSMLPSGWKWVSVAMGPLFALFCWWLTGGTELTGPGRATLAMMVWMAVWWMTEATDLTVTSLLPIVCFPILGVANIDQAAAPYADGVIFLFLGSFIVALAIQRWGLGLRLSLIILGWFGTRQPVIVAGIMAVTALFSMFISNTATVAMMLPIAASIVALEARSVAAAGSKTATDSRSKNFPVCLLLATAYASSIGGIATIIGTPPNVILISFLRDSVGADSKMEISFVQWMMFGVPFSLVFLLFAWFALTRFVFPLPSTEVEGSRALIRDELKKLGSISNNEKWTMIVFLATVGLWVTRPWLAKINFGTTEDLFRPLAGLNDSTIVVGAALLLFLIPCKTKEGESTFLMNWETAKTLPWSVLLLFGGGLSLAAAIKENKVAEFLGHQLAFMGGLPDIVVILFVVTMVVFLTELTSNIATTASVLPVLAGLAIELDMHPALLAIPATMSASCAFMLPVATAPNAIVFGTGQVGLRNMIRAGLVLNFISIGVITFFMCTLVRWVLGL